MPSRRCPRRPWRSPAFLFALVLAVPPSAVAGTWPDGKELVGRLLDLARDPRASVHEIGQSAGGQKLRLLEVAPHTPSEGGDPAVLLLANCEGELPLASLAAVELAAAVLAAAPDLAAARVRWYVLPIASPDGLDRVFANPRAPGGFNASPVDLDGDGLEGEDPHDDLDGDGLITWMLVEDPAGTWLLDPDGLPVPADAARGLVGRYRRETEGKDDDRDGRFNEDPPGGVDIARNFPHDFQPWTGRGGRWPADQPETRAILEFAFSRRDIAMVVVLGEANNLHRLGLPANAGLPNGGRPDTRTAVADTTRRPLPEDLPWLRAMADRYRQVTDGSVLATARLAPPTPGPGSPAAWAYFQLGTPVVALDLWSLPTPQDTLATAVADTGASFAPAPVDTSRPRPAPELVALKRRGIGWRNWTAVTLPDGTGALVGGPEPGALRTPPASEASQHVGVVLPFLLDVPAWLPRLALGQPVVRELGSGVVEVTVHVMNTGRLPYPTAMGALTRRPPPIVVTLSGAEPLQDRLRRTVPQVPAGGAATVRWLVLTGRPDSLTITATAPSLGTVTVTGGSR